MKIAEKNGASCGLVSSLTRIAVVVAGLALIQNAAAVVVFSDDFSGTGVLDGSTPQVGTNWTSTLAGGGSIALGGGATTITGGTANEENKAKAGFTQALSSLNPLLVMTFNISSISATGGNFVQLFSGVGAGNVGGNERIYIGYRNNQTTYSYGGSGSGLGNNGITPTISGAHTFTVTYNFDTGLTTVSDSTGLLASKVATAGLAMNAIQFASGQQFSVSDLNVQFIPEPSGLLLGAISFGGLAVRRRRKA